MAVLRSIRGTRRGLVLAAAALLGAWPVSASPAATSAASTQLRGFATNIFTPQTIGTAAGAVDTLKVSGTPLNGSNLADLELFSAYEADMPESLADVTPELVAMKAAGAQVVRLTFPWVLMETAQEPPGAPPSFNPVTSARITAFLTETQKLGLEVIVNFGGTPCGRSSYPQSFSASQTKDCTHLGPWASYPPSNPADIGAAANQMIATWGTQIYAIEVWNEPNGHFFLDDVDTCDPSDPAALVGPSALSLRAQQYVPMVKAVYQAVKASSHPEIKVFADGSAFSDNTFLQDLYADGMQGFYDAISVHPYHLWLHWSPTPTSCADRTDGHSQLLWKAQDPSVSFPDPEYSFVDGVTQLHNTMLSHNDGAPMWFTEFGFASCSPTPAALETASVESHTAPLGVTTTTDVGGMCVGLLNQGKFLAESFSIAAGWSFLQGLTMFTSRDPGADGESPYGVRTFGVLQHDETPKPSYADVEQEWSCLAAGGSC